MGKLFNWMIGKGYNYDEQQNNPFATSNRTETEKHFPSKKVFNWMVGIGYSEDYDQIYNPFSYKNENKESQFTQDLKKYIRQATQWSIDPFYVSQRYSNEMLEL